MFFAHNLHRLLKEKTPRHQGGLPERATRFELATLSDFDAVERISALTR